MTTNFVKFVRKTTLLLPDLWGKEVEERGGGCRGLLIVTTDGGRIM